METYANTDGRPASPDPTIVLRWLARAGAPIVGWALVAVGALAILVGYFGLADRVLVAEQLPYLISGGIGGMAIVVLGGAFLVIGAVRTELARIEDVEGAVAEMQEMVRDLHGALLAATSTETSPTATTSARRGNGRSAQTHHVWAVAHGTTFHQDACTVLSGKGDVSRLTATSARRRGLEPCPLCQPVGVTA